MKKLKMAIIGQGRSGRNIHGAFLKTEANDMFDVVAIAELIPERRERALNEYPGCVVYEDYREIFKRDDIDLVLNDTYSDTHYSITKEFLERGFNVLVEKPMARNYYECSDLMKVAKENGAVLAVFQQSLYAPMFVKAMEVAKSGVIGEIQQVSIRYNGLQRRWDWQTFQSRLAGSIYNTGPHPIGYGLAFLDFSDDFRVEYSKLASCLTSGDADDYAKMIITAPGKPVVDIEISAIDAYTDYNFLIQGSKGTFKCNTQDYSVKYIADGENPERKAEYYAISDENGMPTYCKENLVTHEIVNERFEGLDGASFSVATETYYKMLYKTLAEGAPLEITPEMISKVVSVIEIVHAQNRLTKRL